MARHRYESQDRFELSDAALLDKRLGYRSAFRVYALGMVQDFVSVRAMAIVLGQSEESVRSMLDYLCQIGWAIELGDQGGYPEHLFLDMELDLDEDGELLDTPYNALCMAYARQLTSGDPDERRAGFRVIPTGERAT